jgi:release factor glutamine methyltransferase
MPEVALPLGPILSQAAERLRRSGVQDPRRQALRIWSELNDVAAGRALVTREAAVAPEQATRFQEAVDRRAAGEPLPYVTGRVGFRHLTLHSDSRALIPRPETEGLVELLLHRVRGGVVADIGTGTGCIALSLAFEGEFRAILAIDSSGPALELARLNHGLLEAPANVYLMRSDLTNAIAPGSLDALISNPPYLTRSEYDSLGPAVRDWEPAEALLAGEDGLDSITRLLHQGRAVVRSGGWLALEVDCTRAAAVERMAAQNGWRNVGIHLDLFGRERYLLAQRSETR